MPGWCRFCSRLNALDQEGLSLARKKEIRSAFVRCWRDLRPLVVGGRLTGSERLVFKRALSVWFRRYAARYGNEDLPLDELAGTLKQAARQWVETYHCEEPGVPMADSGEEH